MEIQIGNHGELLIGKGGASFFGEAPAAPISASFCLIEELVVSASFGLPVVSIGSIEEPAVSLEALQVDEFVDERVDECVDECVDERVDERVAERVDAKVMQIQPCTFARCTLTYGP